MTKGSGGVDGYQAVDISFNTNGWGGLEASDGQALLDGSITAGAGTWYFAVGSFEDWGSGGIPGPANAVQKVVLYVQTTKGKLLLF